MSWLLYVPQEIICETLTYQEQVNSNRAFSAGSYWISFLDQLYLITIHFIVIRGLRMCVCFVEKCSMRIQLLQVSILTM